MFIGESASGTGMQSSKETAINVPQTDRDRILGVNIHKPPNHVILTANLSKDTLNPHATCNSHLSKESA